MRRPVVAVLLACLIGGLAPASLPAAPQAYFSPGGGILAALLREIEEASASIDVAIFEFTAGELAAALVRARARGVAVRVVADARQSAGRHSAIPGLAAAGIEVRLVRGKGRGIMHDRSPSSTAGCWSPARTTGPAPRRPGTTRTRSSSTIRP